VHHPDSDETEEVLKIEQMPLKKGARLVCETGGGGGFGNPLERDPALVRLDVMSGYVTRQSAEDAYGVVLTGEDFRVDAEATKRLRSK